MRTRLLATALTTAMVAIAGYGGPVMLGVSAGVVSQAFATPAPGEPGGNSSKPGDKKKKRDDQRRSSNSGSDDSRRQDSSKDRRSTQDPSHQDQTNSNNDWTPDGDNRSVDIRVTKDEPSTSISSRPGSRPESSPTNKQPDQANPQPEQAAEIRDGIPPRRDLTVEQRVAYGEDRGRLPGDLTKARLADRVASGEVDFNRQPYGDAVPRYEGESPAPDHLVPLRRLAEMPGYADLDKATRESIADSDINIIATTPQENQSRGARTFAEYPGLKNGPPLDPDYKAARVAQELGVYRELQRMIDTAWAQQFPGRPLPSSAGPLDIDRTAPPLDISPTLPPDSLPLQPAPQLPVNSPVELPALPAPVELPANPVPAGPNYPLPPAAQPNPPIVNPAPPAVENPAPVVIPNPEPPAVGVPASPPIANPTPPAIANPNPMSPLEVLFPGAVPSPVSPSPIASDILTNLPRVAPALSPPTAVDPTIRIPVGEVLKRIPEALIRAPAAAIPLAPPVVSPCAWGGCNTPKPMALAPLRTTWCR